MILRTEDWLEMPDGSRYHGETDEPDYCSLLKDGRYDEIVTMALESPCQMTEAASIFFLRVFYLRDNIFQLSNTSIEKVRLAAETGNQYARFGYGRFHVVVKPEDDSADISIDCFKKALDQGLPDAMAALAEAWRYGDMGQVDHEKADKMLAEALEQGSEYAAVLQLRHLVYGTVIRTKNPKVALRKANELIDSDVNQKYSSGLWLYFKALALDESGEADQACCFFDHAARNGVLPAWVDLARMIGKPDSDGNLTAPESYFSTLREGAGHNDIDSRTLLAWQSVLDFDNLEKDKQTEETAAKLIDELKECFNHGSRMAAELIGDIHYNGWLLQAEDNEKAWLWYSKAAHWDSCSGYEKLYDMVYYHDKDVDLTFRDMLALKGTRLGSRHLLNQTVIAHTEGRLDDYATEIERYYDPVFDDDGNDLPDDDGRFDAWA
ncbi:MAG: hypothetical protein ACI3ZS_08630 [Candidatus Cryptobacteroides sp.]